MNIQVNLMYIVLFFSENNIRLESKLHSILNEKRVNKVNNRNEFF